MLEAPNIPLEVIAGVLRDHYRIETASIRFLPIGNDARSFVYCADDVEGRRHFVKLRVMEGVGESHGAPPGGLSTESADTTYTRCLLVTRTLRDVGIHEVVAPVPASSGALGVPLSSSTGVLRGNFMLIVYPYIDGDSAMNVGMTATQWHMHGRALARVHGTRLPDALRNQLREETYLPMSLGFLRKLHARILAGDVVSESLGQALTFWRDHVDTIKHVMNFAEACGAALRTRDLPNVLVHADIHTANVMVDRSGALHYVDWDGPMLAPRERDLKFAIGTSVGDPTTVSGAGPAQEAAFLRGYGIDRVDQDALTYYRYEWVVEDLAAYGNDVFLRSDIGAISRAAAFNGLRQMFAVGDVVELALRSA